MAAALAELLVEHCGGAGTVFGGVHIGLEGTFHDAAVLRRGAQHDVPFAGPAAANRYFQRHGNLALREVLFEFAGERRVDITVETHAFAKAVGALAADDVAFADVAAEAHYRGALEKGKAVSVMERSLDCARDDRSGKGDFQAGTVAAETTDRAHKRTEVGRGVHRRPVAGTLAVEEQLGISAVEGLRKIGGEAARHPPERRPGKIGFFTQRIKGDGVSARDVSYVSCVLQAPLYLERTNAGISQFAKAREQVEVAKRQQGLVADQHAAVGIDQIVQRTAGLDALAPVRRTAVEILGKPAVAAVAHAQRPVHKALQFAGHGLADGADVCQRKLPFQHQAAGAEGLVAAGVFHGADSTLG